MNTLALFWGYLKGEEHLMDEQLAQIDFGNPSFDTEFIIFDPLASSYFQGKFYQMKEQVFYFPHRNLPSMKMENMVTYESTNIKIIDPPAELETPIGIFLCLFMGKQIQIKKAIDFLGEKIELRFSPCDFDLETFYKRLTKTRFEVIPISLLISDLKIDEHLTGNLEVFVKKKETFEANLKTYKPKNQSIKLLVKEVNLQLEIEVKIDGTITFNKIGTNLGILDTIYDVASRSVYTGTR